MTMSSLPSSSANALSIHAEPSQTFLLRAIGSFPSKLLDLIVMTYGDPAKNFALIGLSFIAGMILAAGYSNPLGIVIMNANSAFSISVNLILIKREIESRRRYRQLKS